MESLKKADWELDFYSRPIVEADGKKRWELLITTSQDIAEEEPFRWEKKCPADQVNSVWLSKALSEALEASKDQGWIAPVRIRCWRSSMKTMVKKAASKVGIEMIASKRTYSLMEWISQREREVYPLEEGYLAGPFQPVSTPILNQPIPLPETARGDAWNLSYLSLEMLKDADSWPIEFKGLLPIPKNTNQTFEIIGLRLFSKSRALALAGWLGGLEPVKLVIEQNQLILEAGQEDRWLVSDLDSKSAESALEKLKECKENADGLQFIAIQSHPEEQRFTGFWMLKDTNSII